MNLYFGVFVSWMIDENGKLNGGWRYRPMAWVCESRDEMLGRMHRLAQQICPRDKYSFPDIVVYSLEELLERSTDDWIEKEIEKYGKDK